MDIGFCLDVSYSHRILFRINYMHRILYRGLSRSKHRNSFRVHMMVLFQPLPGAMSSGFAGNAGGSSFAVWDAQPCV